MGIFRYPGGKTRLLPYIRRSLEKWESQSDRFHDCFVGGGSVALDFARRNPDHKIFLNDADEWIYSFWLIVSGNGREGELDRLISMCQVRPTVSLFMELRNFSPTSDVERAYQALFFNRTTFSGIRSSGPIGGYEQKSRYTVDCRYNPDAITMGIREANELLRDRTWVSNLDIFEYLPSNEGIMYLDPPYFDKGEQLYTVSLDTDDHYKLASVLRGMSGWVASYDRAVELENIYKEFADVEIIPARYSINGKKKDWSKKDEMVISSRYGNYLVGKHEVNQVSLFD